LRRQAGLVIARRDRFGLKELDSIRDHSSRWSVDRSQQSETFLTTPFERLDPDSIPRSDHQACGVSLQPTIPARSGG
jgi:hypothetical protein